MAYIKVTLAHTIKNGSKVSFKAPCDCHTVDGIKVYFPTEQGVATNQAFAFTDAHGNDLTGVGNLFKTGAIVKAILNLDESKAYLQNADTNAYLESHFTNKSNPHNVTAAQVGAPTVAEMAAAIAAIPTPDVSGQISTHNTDTTAHADIRTELASKAPAYTYSTTDLTAGTSVLESGKLYFVYE